MAAIVYGLIVFGTVFLFCFVGLEGYREWLEFLDVMKERRKKHKKN